MKRYKARTFFPWLVLIPTLIWYGIFVFYPIGKALFMSLYLWNVTNPSQSIYIGFRRFVEFWSDERFLISFKNTWIYVFVKTGMVVPISFFLALLLHKISKGRNFYLVCYSLPLLMSAAAMGILWRWLYQPNFGLINTVLKIVGLPSQSFLNSPEQAIFSIIVTDVWRSLGFGVIILLSGRLSISDMYYESAKIDGAGEWALFRHITLPLLTNVTLFFLIMTIIWAFQIFDIALVMTVPWMGGPGRSTYIMSILVYNEGFVRVHLGYAAAVAIVMFVITMIFTLFQFRFLSRRWTH